MINRHLRQPLEALFFLALTTGMRKGEILGLMWTDVDWEKSILRVERKLQPISFEGGALVPNKTKTGQRHYRPLTIYRRCGRCRPVICSV